MVSTPFPWREHPYYSYDDDILCWASWLLLRSGVICGKCWLCPQIICFGMLGRILWVWASGANTDRHHNWQAFTSNYKFGYYVCRRKSGSIREIFNRRLPTGTAWIPRRTIHVPSSMNAIGFYEKMGVHDRWRTAWKRRWNCMDDYEGISKLV